MKRVIFELVNDHGAIRYPDDINLFSDVETQGDSLIATYIGDLALTEYMPTVVHTWSKYELRRLFTFDERIAIEASTNVGVRVVSKDMDSAKEIVSNNIDFMNGMAYLVYQGLLTDERHNAIINNEST